jgi:hypothetical protein
MATIKRIKIIIKSKIICQKYLPEQDVIEIILEGDLLPKNVEWKQGMDVLAVCLEDNLNG